MKSDDRIYYKAYSKKTQPKADALNSEMDMQRIAQIVPFGSSGDLEKCGKYQKLMRKKQQKYRLQTTPFESMEEDSKIREWLQNWELTDKWGEKRIKLNPKQLYDSNLCLQKNCARARDMEL